MSAKTIAEAVLRQLLLRPRCRLRTVIKLFLRRSLSHFFIRILPTVKIQIVKNYIFVSILRERERYTINYYIKF